MRILKSLICIILALSLSVAFTGCTSGGTTVSSLTLPNEESGEESQELVEISASEFAKTLEGLCEYLEKNYAVTGDKSEMAYSTIGAVGGYKYIFTYNGKGVQVEVYEFDTENMNELSSKCIDEIKSTGEFTILDAKVPAELSGDSRFMMVYSDTAKDPKNTEQKQRVHDLFSKF